MHITTVQPGDPFTWDIGATVMPPTLRARRHGSIEW